MKNNSIKLLILSKTMSEIGSCLRLIVWPLQAFLLTNDPSMPIIMFIVDQGGHVLGSFVSGYFSDKFNRKNIIIFDDILCGIATILLGCLSASTIYWAIPIGILWSMSNTIALNSYDLFVNDIKEKDTNLRTQYAKIDTPLQIVAIASFIIGGFLVEKIGTFSVFIFDGITFFICAALLTFINYRFEPITDNSKFSFKKELDFYFDGYKFIFKTKWLFYIIIIHAILSTCQGVIFTTYIPFMKVELNASDYHIGFWRLAIAIAFLIANFIMQYKTFEKYSNIKFMKIGISILALSYCAMFFSFGVYPFLFLVLINFIGLHLNRVSMRTEILEGVGAEIKGRVNGARILVGDLFYLFGHVLNLLLIKVYATGKINFLVTSIIYLILVSVLWGFGKKFVKNPNT